MNRLIAVLRDSYREAVSTWVVPAMILFALVLMLLVASVSFRSITLQDELEKQFSTLNAILSFNPTLRSSRFDVENVTTTNTNEPWLANYTFDVVFRATPDAVKQFEGNPGFPLTRRRTQNFVREALPFLTNVNVTDASPPAPAADAPTGTLREYRFPVTSEGTKITERMSWLHQPKVLFAFDYFFTYSLREGVFTLEKRLINDLGAWVLLFVSVVITAGFIPNMLRKGALDLYISKPIGRTELLVYKYLGGLIFALLLTTVLVGGVWLVVGLRSGIWTPHFLVMIPMLTFYFGILYAVSTLVAVVTRSTLMAILATIFAWMVFFGVGLAHEAIQGIKKTERELRAKVGGEDVQDDGALDEEFRRPGERRAPWQVPIWVDRTVTGLHTALPRTSELNDLTVRIIAEGVLTEYELQEKKLDEPLPDWRETVGVSVLFIVLCLAVASVVMSRRDG